jgi:hypothetical protein
MGACPYALDARRAEMLGDDRPSFLIEPETRIVHIVESQERLQKASSANVFAYCLGEYDPIDPESLKINVGRKSGECTLLPNR